MMRCVCKPESGHFMVGTDHYIMRAVEYCIYLKHILIVDLRFLAFHWGLNRGDLATFLAILTIFMLNVIKLVL